MKIVKLKGGLGNQMFQYTYARLLQKRTGEEIRLDYSAYRSLNGDEIRAPRIEKFCLTIPPATEKEIHEVCAFKHKRNSQSFSYRLGIYAESKLNKNYFLEPNRAYINPAEIIHYSYFDGYWQSWRYLEEVKDEIVSDFVPNYELSDNTKRTQETMKTQNAVFIGVRRGDYSENIPHYGSFGSEYYKSAMNYISDRVEHPAFYVFSNDVSWCKKNLDWGRYEVLYREPEHQTSDFEELMLMSSCRHAVIINSSYHWWGATLMGNTDKIVCCPEKWWFDNKPIDIIPNDWMKINKFIVGEQE